MKTRFLTPSLLAMAILFAAPAHAAQSPGGSIQVFKSPTCGCCGLWVEHMKKAGYTVTTTNTAPSLLARIKRQAGLAPDYQSCHTGKIAGYVIEGHVPAEDVARLLREKPEAIGLAVPGMPLGSPGMDMGGTKEPYEVLLIRRDGSSEVFARH